MKNIDKISELKKWVTNQIKATPLDQFPMTINFHEGLEEPIYTVTIEITQQDWFYDKNGVKWVREK